MNETNHPSGHAALLASLQDSLRHGHWRVACGRYLKLLAAGAAVPADASVRCADLLRACSPRDYRRMQDDAAAWAAMCARQRPSAPRVETVPPAASEQSAIRTQWRPFPRAFLRA
jgi:hypothetical protein